ncbi:GUN4 domain-containing protein [Calothrix sp. CCY 0018]|uniref:GUN4 domain-containing protein n=1 Tax=Calothrix sp. CCY 0018 TaxID=3103864 RepID=UPI0039C6AB3E
MIRYSNFTPLLKTPDNQKNLVNKLVDTDYTRLENLLESSRWRSADEETNSIILKITNRVDVGWLREEDFTAISCFDLETIDELWANHSQGHFGFTVQSQIWKTVGEDYAKFSNTVGWRLNYEWQKYSQLKFNLEAPPGHLPAAPFYNLGNEIAIGWAASLSPKLVDCLDESF